MLNLKGKLSVQVSETHMAMIRLRVFKATFNNSSFLSCWSVDSLLMVQTGVHVYHDEKL